MQLGYLRASRSAALFGQDRLICGAIVYKLLIVQLRNLSACLNGAANQGRSSGSLAGDARAASKKHGTAPCMGLQVSKPPPLMQSCRTISLNSNLGAQNGQRCLADDVSTETRPIK